jgi:hypothetical protein
MTSPTSRGVYPPALSITDLLNDFVFKMKRMEEAAKDVQQLQEEERRVRGS